MIVNFNLFFIAWEFMILIKVKEKYIDKYIDLQLSERRAKQKQNKTNRKKIIRDTKLYYMQRKEQQDKQRIMDEMIRNYHR